MDLELKLHVYDGRKIVKTYTCSVFDVYLATVEDVAHALKFDSMKSGSIQEITLAIVGCVDVVRPLLCDMFDGLTPEEARHTRTGNIAEVFQGLFTWFFGSAKAALAERKKK